MSQRDKNRVWVERGRYGEPSYSSEKTLLEKITIAVFWPTFFILSNITLNFYIQNSFNIAFPLLSIEGIKTFLCLVKQFGLKGELYHIALAYAVTFFISAICFRVAFFENSTGKTATDDLHGSSRWASEEDIRNAGLIGSTEPGVICGGWKNLKDNKDYFLTHSGPEHILVVAPTRSGKGVSLIIPSLLTYGSSVFVLDIKGENYLATAGWREENIGPVLRFEPTDNTGTSACFNPLLEIPFGTDYEVADIQKLAQIMIDPDGNSKGDQKHWTTTGASMLAGAILYELHTKADNNMVPTLLDVRRGLSYGETRPMLCGWQEYAREKSEGEGENAALSLLAEIAASMLRKEDKELSSVLSTAAAALSLWEDPIICKNTSTSTFNISSLVNHEKPVSLYLVVPPSDLIRLVPLLRLFVTQMIHKLTNKMKREGKRIISPHRHKLLLMLDEFPQLKQLEVVEKALAQMAGYGLKAYIITQSYTQLTDVYGKDETVSANCAIHICFAPNDENTAKIISDKCGKTTALQGSGQISGKRWALGPFGKNQESISYTPVERPLLYPDEVRRLRPPKKDFKGRIKTPGAVLILVAGVLPIFGTQTLFFKNTEFLRRTEIEPPQKSSDDLTTAPPDEEIYNPDRNGEAANKFEQYKYSDALEG